MILKVKDWEAVLSYSSKIKIVSLGKGISLIFSLDIKRIPILMMNLFKMIIII